MTAIALASKTPSALKTLTLHLNLVFLSINCLPLGVSVPCLVWQLIQQFTHRTYLYISENQSQILLQSSLLLVSTASVLCGYRVRDSVGSAWQVLQLTTSWGLSCHRVSYTETRPGQPFIMSYWCFSSFTNKLKMVKIQFLFPLIYYYLFIYFTENVVLWSDLLNTEPLKIISYFTPRFKFTYFIL